MSTMFTPVPTSQPTSAFRRTDLPVQVGRPATAAAPVAPAEPEAPARDEGHVLFRVGRTTFAVEVDQVREVLRAEHVELLPVSEREVNGRPVALVDARGRSVPVLDLRAETGEAGDVLLPLYRRHVGVVVDRVVAVRPPGSLVRESQDAPEGLPSYALGVLRPVEGGAPILLVSLPAAPDIASGALDALGRAGR